MAYFLIVSVEELFQVNVIANVVESSTSSFTCLQKMKIKIYTCATYALTLPDVFKFFLISISSAYSEVGRRSFDQFGLHSHPLQQRIIPYVNFFFD